MFLLQLVDRLSLVFHRLALVVDPLSDGNFYRTLRRFNNLDVPVIFPNLDLAMSIHIRRTN